MKKILALSALLLAAVSLHAQGVSDALRYSLPTYEGTARTLAMGNAFTALGGDIGGIAVNPAASGVLRHSEFTISPGGVFASSQYSFQGEDMRNSAGSFVLNNAGISLAFDTHRLDGLQNFNFSIAVNRVADFNSVYGFSGAGNGSSILGAMASDVEGTDEQALAWTLDYNPYFESSIPWGTLLAYDDWLVSRRYDLPGNEYIGSTENENPRRQMGGNLRQDYFSRTKGGIMQYAVNFGFNVGGKFFFGLNLNIHSVKYTTDETYSETAATASTFDDGFNSMTSSYWQTTTGIGFSGKFGLIYTPVGGLRLGATFTTPTTYRLFDVWGRNMTSSFNSATDRYGVERKTRYSQTSPQGNVRYRLWTPLRWSIGAAYTFGDLALLSIDYEGADYSTSKLANDSGNSSEFQYENQQISKTLSYSGLLRIGGEIRPVEALSLRLGYCHQDACGTDYSAADYLSGGVGFRFGDELRCSLDAAYQQMLRKSDKFSMYSDYVADGTMFKAPWAEGWVSTGKLVVTFTFRF